LYSAKIVSNVALPAFTRQIGRRVTAQQLITFLLKDTSVHPGELGLPSEVVFLALAILQSLPADEREPWLDRFFQSIGLDADLEELQIWPKFVEWLVLHPFAGVVSDIPDKSARQAVRRAVRFILSGSKNRNTWFRVNAEVTRAKHQLYAAAEADGTLASPMGSGVPSLAAIYTTGAALTIVRESESPACMLVETMVHSAAQSTPIKLQAEALITLLLGGTP
jgi:hypothetical protein